MEKTTVNIGKSVVIKGELNGSEDLTIEGQVEGKIELRQNVLTIGPNGKIKAQVFAKSVIILGEVTGNVTATEKVDIRDNGSVDGDIAAPRVAIAEGRALPRQHRHAEERRRRVAEQGRREGRGQAAHRPPRTSPPLRRARVRTETSLSRERPSSQLGRGASCDRMIPHVAGADRRVSCRLDPARCCPIS